MKGKEDPTVEQEKPLTASPLGSLDQFLKWLSSLKVGIVLMILLIVASTIGTLIPQHNMEEFDRFYAGLTPAERALYGSLGLFDVYHTWWFNVALLLFTLNLVLCSIDHLPATLSYIREPKVSATPLFARAQPQYAAITGSARDLAEAIGSLYKRFGWSARVSTGEGYTTVFGERGAWSRWNFFVVHVSMLLILGAAVVGSRWGYEGTIRLSPGVQAGSITVSGSRWLGKPDRSHPMPFAVACDSIRVELKDRNGPLAPMNVINWYTDVTIKDGEAERKATVAVNKPLDYRGYRFFQSGAGRPGDASRIVVGIRCEGSSEEQTVSLDKNQTADAQGLGRIRFVRFLSDFRAGSQIDSIPGTYENPAAQLEITDSSGEKRNLWVFDEKMAEILERQEARRSMPGLTLEGYRLVLKEFDKVGFEHILQVQYDPGVNTIYLGFVILCGSLVVAFLFSHERVWAVIEQGEAGTIIHLAAHASRSEDRLSERFKSFVRQLSVLAEREKNVSQEAERRP